MPFPYDEQLLVAVNVPPDTIEGVLEVLTYIDATCVDGDGLKWFNWLYREVTAAVQQRVAEGGFADPVWLVNLDVQFARLYFRSLGATLSGVATPGCWRILYSGRDRDRIARIQFAMAGINAHINHDLPLAIVATCTATGTSPEHGDVHYRDYTALNQTLDSLVESAKTRLRVRLLGDALPPVSQLEDMLAAWSVTAAREAAWVGSETLWLLRPAPVLAQRYMDGLDGFTTLAGKALMVALPA